MKKTLSINLNGRVFNIDEDAYKLLEAYLNNLKLYFKKESDCEEIIRDFEARIEELFSERVRLGYEVISVEQVESMIERMGRPEDFGEREDGAEHSGEKGISSSAAGDEKKEKSSKKFYRNMDDKIVGGVCSGIAAYFNWDALIVRIVCFILIFLTQGFFILLYLLLWFLMPPAQTAYQKLEMKGEPITIENIGKTVSGTTGSVQNKQNDGCLGFLAKSFLVGVGCLFAFPVLFIIVVVLVVLLYFIYIPIESGNMWISASGWELGDNIVSVISLLFLIGVPLFFFIYGLFARAERVKPVSMPSKWIGFIIWVIALVVLIISIKQKTSQFFRDFIDWEHHTTYTVTTSDDESGDSVSVIQGSGTIGERMESFPAFNSIKLEKTLVANLIIKQQMGDSSRITINGDENIIDKVVCKEENGTLKLSLEEGHKLSYNNLIILVSTPSLSGIALESAGRVTLENKFTVSDLHVTIEGFGAFHADSLYCSSLHCRLKGVGGMKIGGKSNLADLSLESAGEIDAKNLEAINVNARLKGVGQIICNPTKSLNASLQGAGRIVYKGEPKQKKLSSSGVGKIEKAD